MVAVDAMLPLLGIPSAPAADNGGSAALEGMSSLRPVAMVKGVLGAVVCCCLPGAMRALRAASSSSKGGRAAHPAFSFQVVVEPVPEMVSAMLSRRGCGMYWAPEERTGSSVWGEGREVGW